MKVVKRIKYIFFILQILAKLEETVRKSGRLVFGSLASGNVEQEIFSSYFQLCYWRTKPFVS
jgi:hypothetical protein